MRNRKSFRAGRGEGGVKLGHFDKHFVKNTRDPAKHFGVFLLDTLKLYFEQKFNPKMDTVRAFLSKIRTLFWFSKRTGEASHFPLVAHQCPWICLIYPWKCLNKLFYASALNMLDHLSYIFDRLLKMPRVLNMPRFWIWHGCIYKS